MILPTQMVKQFITKEKKYKRQLKLQLHENNIQRTINCCYYNFITSIMLENDIEGCQFSTTRAE
jgi:hypothetical protein